MSDIRIIARSIKIHLPDESCIDLDLNITIKTESGESIANERMTSQALDKTLETIQFLLITVLGTTTEKMAKMAKQHGT